MHRRALEQLQSTRARDAVVHKQEERELVAQLEVLLALLG